MEDALPIESDPITNVVLLLDWIAKVIAGRLDERFAGVRGAEVPPLTCYDDGSWLPRFLARHDPKLEELAIIVIGLLPHIDPSLLERLVAERLPEGGDFPEFGGAKGASFRRILPTGETAQFVVAGDDLERRLMVQRMLGSEHWFWKKRVLWLAPVPEGEPAMSGRLVLDPEIVEELTTGRVSRPRFGSDFPAERIETALDWEDLVLDADTLGRIREIETWIRHNDMLLGDWGMARHVKPGYRVLFHGPPGTGKTLTATVLGKHAGRDVFRVDLSRVISKYIGETEQNLARLFDKAENKDWILFFDEADAIFGKRTDIRDAHDKYANQEVAYMLQRIEAYSGLVILASNQRGNIDDAFVRRLQNVVQFPIPGARERQAIWRRVFPPQIATAGDIDWQAIAARHELTGAGIVSVTHFCALELLARGAERLDLASLEAAILREYVKEGRVV
jgi:hypothetical protein